MEPKFTCPNCGAEFPLSEWDELEPHLRSAHNLKIVGFDLALRTEEIDAADKWKE